MGYMLKTHEQTLKEIGLHRAIRNVQNEIPQSPYNLFGLLEMYNFETSTVFTPVGNLGLTLHVIYEVLALSIREFPYEEYISTTKELNMLNA